MPALTALQYLVLRALISGELGAKDLKEVLRDNDVKKSSPAFYQLMTRLEEKGYIDAWWDEEADHHRTRKYRITGEGQRSVHQTEAFYTAVNRALA
ncbi:MAG: helix-turn-helix transcriptional regulator [Deltaproteobacteria bacterium]